MKIHVRKTGMVLSPHTEEDRLKISGLAKDDVYSVDIVKPRNYKYLQKYMTMIRTGFDLWEPTAEYKGVVVQKDIKSFRKDVQIMAGYRHMVVNTKNEIRWKSDSVSFANCTEEHFNEVYNNVLNVILGKILTNNYTAKDFERVRKEAEQILRYT